MSTVQPSSANHDASRNDIKPGHAVASEYVFSLPWFLAGLIAFVLLAGTVTGLYFYQVRNLAGHMIDAAEKLEQDGKIGDAINLLVSYSASRPNDTQVWRKLGELVQKNIDSGNRNLTRAIRIHESMKSRFGETEQLPILEKIMQWKWEQQQLTEAMNQAREIITLGNKLRLPEKEYYSAWKIYAMGSVENLDNINYRPDIAGIERLPQSIDKLLQKVYEMKPDDIEISVYYASVIRDDQNDAFKKNSSEELLKESPAIREARATEIIDNMVALNPKSTKAYLSRYRYRMRFVEKDLVSPTLDPDLQKAVEIDPKDIGAKIQAGVFEFTQALKARAAGNTEEYQKRKRSAEAFFNDIGKVNPKSEVGFRYLGDLHARVGETEAALAAWKEGAERIKPAVNAEIQGRYIVALIERAKFAEASSELARMEKFFAVNRQAPSVELRVRNLIDLLRAQIYAAEGAAKTLEGEKLKRQGKMEEARTLLREGTTKVYDAVQMFETLLKPFGDAPGDLILQPDSVYTRVLGDSLMILARLKSDQGKWDESATYFDKAVIFPDHQERAYLGAAAAYQQQNQPETALALLAKAISLNPDNEAIRFVYTQALFRNEMAHDAINRDFEGVEKQLERLEESKSTLPQPWAVDLLKIQIQFVRDGASADTDRAVAAQQNALKKMRELEHKEFPRRGETFASDLANEKRVYGQDLGFLSAVAGIYSAMASIHDFERVTNMMLDLPGGEVAYYTERANDALRGNDKEGMIEILKQAVAADIPEDQKQRFIDLMEQVQMNDSAVVTVGSSAAGSGTGPVLDRLTKAFQENPDSLKPQAFFILANGAIDREDWKAARVYEDRLKAIEGEEEGKGDMWRFVQARRILSEEPDSPQIVKAKELQEEIVKIRPRWDMAYILAAMIEEKSPSETTARGTTKNTKKIENYKLALKYGNTAPEVWELLISLLMEDNRMDEAQEYQRDAILKGIRIGSNQNQFPQPYQRYYTEVFKAINREDFEEADRQGRACVLLAQRKREKPDLIFELNMAFGKMFMDANYTNLAEKYLQAVHVRGGVYVYPLAVCYAKAGRVDDGFALLLDEIDRMPSSRATLIPSILVLMNQVRPSERIFERIDELMLQVETGEIPVLDGNLEHGDEERRIDFGEKRLFSFVIRFPGQTALPDPKGLTILAPLQEDQPSRVLEAAPANPAPGEGE